MYQGVQVQLLFLNGELTTLYPQTKRKVELLDKDIFGRIQEWAMFSAMNELEIEDYFKKKISYKGIRYKGAPERAYWHYFQPFFEHEIPRVLSEVEDSCRNKGLNPEEYVNEAAKLLKIMVSRLWNEIAKTDQRLKGCGFPKSKDLKEVSGTIESYHKKIDAEVRAILHRGTTVVSDKVSPREDIIDVKPNFMGIGLNLNAAFRWIKNIRKNM